VLIRNRGKYGNWEEELMERALVAYRMGDMGLNCAARTSQCAGSNPEEAIICENDQRDATV